jgi:hypothetical protein
MQPPIFPMTAPPNTSLKKQIPSSRERPSKGSEEARQLLRWRGLE